ncbi:MAG TPA: hypothetical protein VFH06_05290 [Candidatus Saccharimonadales bacterium]|nr:hypothetical protein [Candidatus Saccharimonadales bacterium]
MTSSKLQDQSNYVVAFLAVAVGLLIFRPELENIHLPIFSIEISLFLAAVIFVSMLVIAVYLNALALVVTNFNITRVPLNSYIEKLASFLMIFGLLSPLMLLMVVLLSWLVHLIDWSGIVNSTVSSIIAGVAGIITGAVAGYTTDRRDKIKLESLFYKEEQEAIQAQYRMKSDGDEYAFLEHYEFVTSYTREYIRALGYGIRSFSIGFMAKILYDKKMISKKELENMRWVNTIRNSYAHAESKIKASDQRKAEDYLEDFMLVIKREFARLIKEKR